MMNEFYIIGDCQMANVFWDEGLECETYSKTGMPSQLGSFISSNSKRIMKNFSREIDGCKTNSLFYTDRHTLHIEQNDWDVLVKTDLIAVIYVGVKTNIKMVEVSMRCF